MKTIKFQENSREDAFFHDVREKVRAYFKQNGYDGYATWPVWLKGSIYGLLSIAMYILIVVGNLPLGWWWMCWIGWGLFSLLFGLNIGHDGAHNALHGHKGLNKFLFYLSFNALGANAYLWGLRHVQSHHLFPNVDGCDADIDDTWVLRLSPNRPVYRFHRYQHIYAPVLYLFYSLIWVFYKDFKILNKKRLANLRNIRHPRSEVWLFFILKALYIYLALLLPIQLSGYSMGQVFVGFILMHFGLSYAFIFGLIGSHFSDEAHFQNLDARGYLPHSWAIHQLITSVDYHAQSPWANIIFGGFNAHSAHHLFPKVSHIHYPAISKVIEDQCHKYNIPYKNLTIGEAIRAHFRYLKKMGRER
jgi:linoleoyl-CoA desaturase